MTEDQTWVDEETESSSPSSSEGWVQDVETLAHTDEPVESRELALDFSNLEEVDIEFLDGQTERTLDRHADVQDEHRKQANYILRAMIIIIGAIGTVTPFLVSFFQSLSFVEIAVWRGAMSLCFLLIAVMLSESIAIDILSIVDSAFDVLSPEKTERGLIGRLLTLLEILGPEAVDEESGAGVRSVSILDELAKVIDKPHRGLQPEVLMNRLNRVRRNERVIDQNSKHLHDTYERAKRGLEKMVGILVLLTATLMLLGAEI